MMPQIDMLRKHLQSLKDLVRNSEAYPAHELYTPPEQKFEPVPTYQPLQQKPDISVQPQKRARIRPMGAMPRTGTVPFSKLGKELMPKTSR